MNSSVPVAPVRSRVVSSERSSHSPKSEIRTRGLFLLLLLLLACVWGERKQARKDGVF